MYSRVPRSIVLTPAMEAGIGGIAIYFVELGF